MVVRPSRWATKVEDSAWVLSGIFDAFPFLMALQESSMSFHGLRKKTHPDVNSYSIPPGIPPHPSYYQCHIATTAKHYQNQHNMWKYRHNPTSPRSSPSVSPASRCPHSYTLVPSPSHADREPYARRHIFRAI